MLESRMNERIEIIEGLVKAGVEEVIADKLASRYFNNEVTIRDLENLKENLKLEFNGKFKLLDWKITFLLTFQIAIMGGLVGLIALIINKIP